MSNKKIKKLFFISRFEIFKRIFKRKKFSKKIKNRKKIKIKIKIKKKKKKK